MLAPITGQQATHQLVEVVHRGEQSRMTCYPTHSIGVAVMDLSAQQALAPGAELGRRKSFQDRSELVAAHHFQVDERGRVQSERAEKFVPAVLVQAQAGDLLDHRAE